jgi:molybdopterin-binding protein
MKLSAPNAIDGAVREIKKGVAASDVLMDVGGAAITASITNESVEELSV